MTVEAFKETLEFQTEVKQLLKLMIHSLYSNKEIFLRELISNASDACDKLRFEAIGRDGYYENDSALKIRVGFDAKAKTITVTDNGIGMSRDELVQNIGTIASSGTKRFMDSLSGDQAKDSHLIGQFGVGFYSTFIVADKVTVLTRRAGAPVEQGVHWESDGEGSYTLETMERAQRGTEIILHLRDEEKEFADGWRLRNIIHKYSDHIPVPIVMPKENHDEKDVSEPEDETVNKASALWTRARKDVTDEEYQEFYKHIAHDFDDPMVWSHNRVEGSNSYTSLLFIPKHAPFDLYDRDRKHGIKLYVKRVFIMDETEHLMPNYLRFVRGVVDSDDLPLNVSREILQHNKVIDKIRSASVKKVLAMLDTMAKDNADQYATFWKEFGKVMKEGPLEDSANKDQIAGLLRFSTTQNDSEQQTVSLHDYVSRMKEGQKAIYFITADGFSAAKNSPHLEIFRRKGIEVILMSDRVDDWMVGHLTEFEGKKLQSVAKGDLDLGDIDNEEDKEVQKKAEGDYKEVIEGIKECLKDKAKDVRLTHRLTDSPSCLVLEQYDMGMQMQQILKAAGQHVPSSKPILELNPQHPLVSRLLEKKDQASLENWSHILFDQAMLAEAGQLDDPAAYVRRVNSLLQSS
jgi:molecular chaperone HtpG